jgi:hypothetical protein
MLASKRCLGYAMLKKGCLKLDTALSTLTKSAQIKSRQHQNTASKHQTPSRVKNNLPLLSHHPDLTPIQPSCQIHLTQSSNLEIQQERAYQNNAYNRLPLYLLQLLIYNHKQNRDATRETKALSKQSKYNNCKLLPNQCLTQRVVV